MKKLLLSLAAVSLGFFAVNAETVTLDFSTEAGIKAMNSTVAIPGISAGTNVNDVAFTLNGVTITGTAGDTTEARIWGTTTAGVYQYRLYSGATMTVSCAEKITSIKVKSNANGNIAATGYSGGTWTGSAEKVVFSVSGTIQISSIEVTYGEATVDPNPGGGDDPVTPPAGDEVQAAFYATASYTGTAKYNEPIINKGSDIVDAEFIAGDISIKLTKVNSSSSNVTSNQVRWYQNDYFTITPLNGATVTKIVIDEVSGNANNAIASVGSTTQSGTTLTWTGVANEAFTLTAEKQIRFTLMTVTYIEASTGDLIRTTASFPESSYDVAMGSTFEAPVLTTNSNGTQTYSSSNEAVATVDASTGAVEIKGVGITSISVVIAANDTYTEGRASYILTVAPSGVQTVAQAIAAFNAGYTGPIEVKGYVTAVSEISIQYGNATYDIADEKSGAEALTVYHGYWLDGEKFTAGNEIAVGGEITVSGSLIKYNNGPQIGSSSVVSYTAPEGGEDPDQPDQPVDEYTAVFNFTDPTSLSPAQTAPAASGETDLSNVTLTAEGVTLKISDKVGNTAPRLWNSSGKIDFRLYTGESFIIEVDAEEYHLTSIAFTKSGGAFAFDPNVGILNNGTWTPGEATDVATMALNEYADVQFSVTATSRIDTITVKYADGKGQQTTAIDGVTVEENAAPVYYNLQGVRLNAPEKGINIVVKGNKAEKVIF